VLKAVGPNSIATAVQPDNLETANPNPVNDFENSSSGKTDRSC
jgi:hypothetical protein